MIGRRCPKPAQVLSSLPLRALTSPADDASAATLVQPSSATAFARFCNFASPRDELSPARLAGIASEWLESLIPPAPGGGSCSTAAMATSLGPFRRGMFPFAVHPGSMSFSRSPTDPSYSSLAPVLFPPNPPFTSQSHLTSASSQRSI
jgi:hypothetical protein